MTDEATQGCACVRVRACVCVWATVSCANRCGRSESKVVPDERCMNGSCVSVCDNTTSNGGPGVGAWLVWTEDKAMVSCSLTTVSLYAGVARRPHPPLFSEGREHGGNVQRVGIVDLAFTTTATQTPRLPLSRCSKASTCVQRWKTSSTIPRPQSLPMQALRKRSTRACSLLRGRATCIACQAEQHQTGPPTG